ncbi:DUF6484 domain-containing protein [Mesorhizobium sp. WSM3859]|uniref:DUF6484 domain-containing protein n=1 Tax=Mesorhizobium sp. WSM3859 TaxID=2029402 RepID=UPI000BAF7CBD|nr:DUF6484 domain-containing protein [Mesorhizobium sp. WSM3859]PBC07834.1 hypothetical protein CK230_24320 [Mesorhizobium sp. WSM3859]
MSKVKDRIDGVVIGQLMGFEGDAPLVVFAGNRRDVAVAARSLVALEDAGIGAELALLFEQGDPGKPLIVGRIVGPGKLRSRSEISHKEGKVLVEAAGGIELRCGKASIVMHPDGRITIRGSNIVSHASVANRIRGGSVHLN